MNTPRHPLQDCVETYLPPRMIAGLRERLAWRDPNRMANFVGSWKPRPGKGDRQQAKSPSFYGWLTFLGYLALYLWARWGTQGWGWLGLAGTALSALVVFPALSVWGYRRLWRLGLYLGVRVVWRQWRRAEEVPSVPWALWAVTRKVMETLRRRPGLRSLGWMAEYPYAALAILISRHGSLALSWDVVLALVFLVAVALDEVWAWRCWRRWGKGSPEKVQPLLDQGALAPLAWGASPTAPVMTEESALADTGALLARGLRWLHRAPGLAALLVGDVALVLWGMLGGLTRLLGLPLF